MQFKFFFNLPKELRLYIYRNISASDRTRLKLTSMKTKEEIFEFYDIFFKATNTIAIDHLNFMKNPASNPDRSTAGSQIEAISHITPEWIINNLAIQYFIYDEYNQYANFPLCIRDNSEHQLEVQSEDLSEDQLETPSEEQILEDPDDFRTETGKIYISLYNNSLQCYACTYAYAVECKIELKDNHGLRHPLTHDQLKSYESIIQTALGKKSVEQFLHVLKSNMNYYHLFNQKQFQHCYIEGKINHEEFTRFCMLYELNDYTKLFCEYGAFLMISTPFQFQHLHKLVAMRLNEQALKFMVNNPEGVKYWLKSMDKFNLSFIMDEFNCCLITDGIVTFSEFLQHQELANFAILLRQNVTQENPVIWAVKESDWNQSNPEQKRFILELFCAGLSQNEITSIKREAIRVLAEHNKIFIRNTRIHTVLAAELAGVPGKCLTDEDIRVLKGPVSTGEILLTKIVRTMILEPLNLVSVDQLNPDSEEKQSDYNGIGNSIM